MTRTKITARIPPNLVESLQRLAALNDRSVSEVVEDAIIKSFTDRGEGEHAAVVFKLDVLARRLAALERAHETHFELSVYAARFAMSIAPEIPDQDRAMINARGASRFQSVITAIIARLASGRSVLREQFSVTPVAKRPEETAAE